MFFSACTVSALNRNYQINFTDSFPNVFPRLFLEFQAWIVYLIVTLTLYISLLFNITLIWCSLLHDRVHVSHTCMQRADALSFHVNRPIIPIFYFWDAFMEGDNLISRSPSLLNAFTAWDVTLRDYISPPDQILFITSKRAVSPCLCMYKFQIYSPVVCQGV